MSYVGCGGVECSGKVIQDHYRLYRPNNFYQTLRVPAATARLNEIKKDNHTSGSVLEGRVL